ncbi:GPI-anchored protein LLG1-like [Hordeum vulgare subsp. vulgare]|uniref:GPI-anchored protein LLG1-like n=1 Tax=Hordeum vulgare subsp. vulgare TaxID=112509 RepID=UPI001D1A4E4A|nr:GPI-anchored protein LLG1-like [Hordeum vulgare subsp. vulgare]
MALVRWFLFLFLAAALAGFASAAPFVSDSVFHTRTGSTGRRSLLQTKDPCPLSFESQDYTIITSKCKAPLYPPTECCDAFKKFACPFATYLNNRSTDCAETMLTYINFLGSYPSTLFYECVVGLVGLSCEGVPAIETGMSNGGQRAQGSSRPLIALLCALGTRSIN